MFKIPKEDVQSYMDIPAEFTNGVRRKTVVFVADDGNHFNHYGIFEGMFLIFDLEAKFKRGHLSCFFNKTSDEENPKYKMSDVPIKGYRHIGRLIAAVRNYEVL